MAEKKITRRLSIYINGQEIDNTLSNLRKNLTKFRAAAARATQGSEDWKKYNRAVGALEAELQQSTAAQKAFRRAAKETALGISDQEKVLAQFGQSASQLFLGIRQGDFVQIREGFRGLREGISGAAKAAMAFVATPIGAALAALAGIGLAAKAWLGYNDAALAALRLTQQITGLSNAQADQARIRAELLQETFGKELQENLEIARVLVQSFGVSYQEAFDSIEDQLIRGQQNNEEYFQSLREYSVFFANAGFSAQEFGQLIATGYDLGFYKDKLPDALKEFALSVNEQTQASRDALNNAFGPGFTNTLFDNIKSGAITVKEAFAQIAQETQKQGLNTQQAAQLTADLFKGAGEDAGGALKIFEAFDKALNQNNQQLSKSQQLLKEQTNATKELKQISSALFFSGEKGFGLMLDRAKLFLTQGIVGLVKGTVGLINYFIDLRNQSRLFSVMLAGLGAVARVPFTLLMGFLKSARIGFSGLGELILGAFSLDGDRITKGIQIMSSSSAAFFKEIAENAQKSAQKVKDAFAGTDQIQRISLESVGIGVDSAQGESEIASDAAESAEFQNSGSDGALTAEDQKVLDSRKKLKELLDEFDQEQELQKTLEQMDAQQQAEEQEVFELENKFIKLEEQAMQEAELLTRLEAAKGIELQQIRDKHAAIRSKKETEEQKKITQRSKKFKDDQLRADAQLAKAKADVLAQGISVLQGFFDQNSKVYKALFIAQKAFAATQVILKGIEERAKIAAAYAAIPGGQAIAAPMMIASKIRTGVGLAQIAATVLKSFEQGGETGFGNQGLGRNSGGFIQGVVEEGEYVIPRFVRRDPEVPQIIDYLEAKRSLRSYANGGSVGSFAGASNWNLGSSDTGPAFGAVRNTSSENQEDFIPNSTSNSIQENQAETTREMLALLQETKTLFSSLSENGITAHSLIGDDQIRGIEQRNDSLKSVREQAKINTLFA